MKEDEGGCKRTEEDEGGRRRRRRTEAVVKEHGPCPRETMVMSADVSGP